MAISDIPQKVRVNMLLNNGFDSEGNVKTLSVSIGTLDINGYDNAKAIAVITALMALYSKDLYSIQKTLVSSLDEEG